MLDLPLLPVGPGGALYLFLVGVFLPWAIWKSSRRARGGPPPSRRAHAAGALQTAAFLGVIGLVVAHQEEIALFPAAVPSPRDVGLGVVATVALLLALSPYRQKIARRNDPRMQLFCEPTRADRGRWMLVSLSAGVWEEIVYRGVVTTLCLRATGSAPLAVVLALLAFAGGHLHRGLGAMLPVTLVAAVVHAFVFLTGALYVSMLVHFLYDMGAGFDYMRLAARHGIRSAAPPAGVTRAAGP